MMEKKTTNNNAGVSANNITENRNTEPSSMMNNATDNNVDISVLSDLEQLESLAELIAEEEQAVTGVSSQEDQKMIVVETLSPSGDVTSEIPEEERGTTEEEFPVEMEEASKCGCFYPTLGMTGFVTNTGHKIHARIYMDSKRSRIIEYCQEYNDGSCSAKMKIKQADLLMAASYCFDVQKTKNAKLKSLINNFIMEVSRDYFNKIAFPSEAMNIPEILNLMLHQYNNIHVESETGMSKLDQPDKLYPAVIGLIKKNHFDIGNEHAAYYTLEREQIDTLAGDLNVKPTELLKKLKAYRFLYLTESSEGYQTCVRFKAGGEFFPKPYTQWCYCVLKLDYLAKRKMQKANEQAAK